MVCHTGGALGSDNLFENLCIEQGIEVRAYSYKTPYHKSPNKVEVSDIDFLEGVERVKIANKTLKRRGYQKYINLLARNWSQVKYSDTIIAVSVINNNMVNGGTSWAIQMGIDCGRPVFVFDQNLSTWFRWSYISQNFVRCDKPIITENFAGIGTRKLNTNGIEAINSIFYQ